MSYINVCEHCGVILAEKAVVCDKCNIPVKSAYMEKLSRPDVVKARKECESALDTRDGRLAEKVRDMFSQKEELKNYLDSEEQFVFAIKGAFVSHNLLKKYKNWPDTASGDLVATTKRVIVVCKPLIFGKIKTLSLPYSEILTIEKGHHGTTGPERMTGAHFHNFIKFTASDGRYLIADRLEVIGKYFDEFYNFVASMIRP